MPEILVPESRVPVLRESDVLVCGGGAAGVCAAVSAARHGCSVTLVERWPFVGGMATAGLVNCFHRSDREKTVIHGLCGETVERLDRNGWITLHVREPAHETEWFEPEGMKVVWHRMLAEAGVTVCCNLTAGEPIIEEGRLRGILVDTKTGRKALLARILIDDTGDADLAHKAGVPTDFGREADGRVQGMTLIYRLTGIDDARRRSIPSVERAAIHAEMKKAVANGELPPANPGADPCGFADRWPLNMCPVSGNPLDEIELTAIASKAREQVQAYIAWFRSRIPGFENATLDQSAMSLGIRESRRMRGMTRLTREDVLGARKRPDTIGHGVWMIDIHDPCGSGYTTHSDRNETNMLPAGESYHIPLSMCLPEEHPNLAVVGRAASSTHEAHASVRVMSHGCVQGQGLGTAAALALDTGCDLAAVNVRKLQERLRSDGTHLEDIPEQG